MRPFGFKAENKNIVKQSTLENLTKDGDLMEYDDVAEQRIRRACIDGSHFKSIVGIDSTEP
ncbi:hypothetical protein KIN20_020042 [Parelaphostrongylus tenuis]|uniref:Uncharacterized protein n=1 Tax=Parelaphostrongylus tenuis TaxID=148309 RepID=A0AAD5N2U8_PARTN|nr:hypothetical protein KIN20_020042 [Parelaphostrongylus tenuis]